MTESEFSKIVNDAREKAFVDELHALLKKYKVEIELEESSRDWSGSTYDITFSLEGYHDETADAYVYFRDVKLGNYITGEK